MRLTLRHIAAATAFIGCSLSAHADNVDFLGYANGAAVINFSITSSPAPISGTAGAGGFLTTLNGGPSFVSFCTDLYQFINFSDPAYAGYTPVSASAYAFTNAQANADLGKLFTAYGASSSANAVSSAAFQTAVWEIAYETSGGYNLNSGNAKFSGDSNAVALASSWLANLGAANNANINVLKSAQYQDMVFSAPVPEPSNYALLIAGLAAVGFAVRRRRLQD